MAMFNIIQITQTELVSLKFDLPLTTLQINLKLCMRQVWKYLLMRSFFCGKGDWDLNNIFPQKGPTLE